MTAKRAAIYCRVSTINQEVEGTSLESQEESCRAYAAASGYSLAGVYRETHSAAYLNERPQLNAIRTAMKRGEVDVLLAWALDRLSRNQAHVYIIAEECKESGVSLELVTEDFEKTTVGEFIRSATTFAAQIEREKIRERTQAGKRKRVESGLLMAAKMPKYGYRFRTERRGQYDINPDTAFIVGRIYALALDGMTTNRIAKLLTEEGVPSPTGLPQWCRSVIHRILTDVAYTGIALTMKRKYTQRSRGGWDSEARPLDEQKRLPEGTIPAIIDQETFTAVGQRLARNKEAARRNNRQPQDALLRGGHVRCAYCGRSMQANTPSLGSIAAAHIAVATSSGPCPITNAAGGTPSRRGYSTREIWNVLSGLLAHPERIAAQLWRLERHDPTTEDLLRVERRISEDQRQQANLVKRVAQVDDDELAAPYMDEITRLGKALDAHRDQRGGLHRRRREWKEGRKRQRDLELWCNTVAGNLPTLTYEDRRTILHALQVRVTVSRQDEGGDRWTMAANFGGGDVVSHAYSTSDAPPCRSIRTSTGSRSASG